MINGAVFGFKVYQANGHDVKDLTRILKKIHKNKFPSVLICHTLKGKGIKMIENNISWHHKSNLNKNEIDKLNYYLNNYLLN